MIAVLDGPSSTIGGCIMSALSIPPSQKVCKAASLGLEAMHNYANLINPIAYMESDQYSMVTVYEVEVELGATEVSEDLVETSEEICIQTEDLSSAAVSDHDASGDKDVEEERIDGEKLEEGVDIAMALETLTKTLAPKDETLQGQNAVELNDSNDKRVNEDEEAGAIENGSEHCAEHIEHGVEEERESLVVHLLPGNLDTNGGSESIEGEVVSVNDSTSTDQEEPGLTQEEPVSETQQSASLVNVKSCHLQVETLTSGQQIIQLQDPSQQIMYTWLYFDCMNVQFRYGGVWGVV